MANDLDFNPRSGTFCGTIMVILLQVHAAELLKTVLLATIGALVSFTMSILLKWLMKCYRRKRFNRQKGCIR